MEILQNFLGWLLDRSGSLPDLHGSLSQIWWLQIISLFGPYALIMTVLFCLNFLYEKWRPEGKFHPQQESFRRHAHLFFYLMGSNLLGLTLILIPMLVLDRLHLVKIYANKAQYGMPYFYASFFLLLIVHDAYGEVTLGMGMTKETEATQVFEFLNGEPILQIKFRKPIDSSGYRVYRDRIPFSKSD